MEEVRSDHVGGEGGVALLEDDGHDVVADVPLALQLLRVVLRVGQQRGHVEHDLLLAEHFVDALFARLPVQGIQAALESARDFGSLARCSSHRQTHTTI